MKKELNWFSVEGAYGGNQDWMEDEWMNRGGCGALTACDTCIYLAREMGEKGMYPLDLSRLTKEDYIRFGMMMKPYLSPRPCGINTLEIYMDGFKDYLKSLNMDDRLLMAPFEGIRPWEEAAGAVKGEIDRGLPVPCLILRHDNPAMEDYVWHWFLLTGYECLSDRMMVKAVTYGNYRWLSMEEMWNTGFEERGGVVLYSRG